MEPTYVPLPQRVQSCLLNREKSIKDILEKQKASFKPSTNERSREILRRKKEREEIAGGDPDILAALLAAEAGDSLGRSGRRSVSLRKKKKKYRPTFAVPINMNEDAIKLRFRQSVEQMRGISRSKRYFTVTQP